MMGRRAVARHGGIWSPHPHRACRIGLDYLHPDPMVVTSRPDTGVLGARLGLDNINPPFLPSPPSPRLFFPRVSTRSFQWISITLSLPQISRVQVLLLAGLGSFGSCWAPWSITYIPTSWSGSRLPVELELYPHPSPNDIHIPTHSHTSHHRNVSEGAGDKGTVALGPSFPVSQFSMAPHKFGSVRHNMKPRQLASFRDDSALIAFRYEQTVQAEPPIPLPPPRNPLRTTVRLSTTGTVVPITIIPPPVAPPQEEHPLFRTQPSPSVRSEEWKRDSGLARSSSSATLREELEEDVVYQKILDDIADAPSVYSGDEQSPSDAPSRVLDDTNAAPAPLRLPTVAVTVLPISPTATVESPGEPLPSPTPTRASSISKRLGLVKTFSIRSTGNKRLRKKTVSVDNFDLVKEMDRVASPDADATANGVVRGSANTQEQQPPRVARPSPAKEDETTRPSQAVDSDFIPITTSIPEDGLWDDFSNLSFSKRGSLMFGGKTDPFAMMMSKPAGDGAESSPDASESAAAPDPAPHAATDAAAAGPRSGPAVTATSSEDAATEEKPAARILEESASLPSIRVVSIDVERESQKVRSLYESGEGLNWQDGGRASYCERLEPTEEVPSDEEENVVYGFPLNAPTSVVVPD